MLKLIVMTVIIDIRIIPQTLFVGDINDINTVNLTIGGHITIPFASGSIVTFNVSGNIKVINSHYYSNGSNNSNGSSSNDGSDGSDNNIMNYNTNNRSREIMVRFGRTSLLSLSYALPSLATTMAFNGTTNPEGVISGSGNDNVLRLCDNIISWVDHYNNVATITCILPFGSWHDFSFSLW